MRYVICAFSFLAFLLGGFIVINDIYLYAKYGDFSLTTLFSIMEMSGKIGTGEISGVFMWCVPFITGLMGIIVAPLLGRIRRN